MQRKIEVVEDLDGKKVVVIRVIIKKSILKIQNMGGTNMNQDLHYQYMIVKEKLNDTISFV